MLLRFLEERESRREMTTRRGVLAWFCGGCLRPPGAVAERDFVSLCIKCGRCVASCPYHAIAPAGWGHGLAAGTPVIDPEKIPCYLCMACTEVCPTGALRPVRNEDVAMGTARIDTDLCYAYQRILCRACVDICPFQGEAIRQNLMLEPLIDQESCAGCGLCVPACPAAPKAIRVEARTRGSAAMLGVERT